MTHGAHCNCSTHRTKRNKIAVEMDQTYDDLFSSLGQAVCLCTILFVLGDFFQIILIMVLVLVWLKVYEVIVQPHKKKQIDDVEWKYIQRMVPPLVEVIRKTSIRRVRSNSSSSSSSDEDSTTSPLPKNVTHRKGKERSKQNIEEKKETKTTNGTREYSDEQSFTKAGRYSYPGISKKNNWNKPSVLAKLWMNELRTHKTIHEAIEEANEAKSSTMDGIDDMFGDAGVVKERSVSFNEETEITYIETNRDNHHDNEKDIMDNYNEHDNEKEIMDHYNESRVNNFFDDVEFHGEEVYV